MSFLQISIIPFFVGLFFLDDDNSIGCEEPTNLKCWTYIQKAGFRGFLVDSRICREFKIFCKKIVWERVNTQDYTVCRAKTVISPWLCSVIVWILDKNISADRVYFQKNAPWHQIFVILMIYSLLSQNFIVQFYSLFLQIFWD